MKKFAFVSRHVPTQGQHALAGQQHIELVPQGDLDAFSEGLLGSLRELQNQGFEGIVCVHPLIALRANQLGLEVGLFENQNRAPEGEKPQFEASRLIVVLP